MVILAGSGWGMLQAAKIGRGQALFRRAIGDRADVANKAVRRGDMPPAAQGRAQAKVDLFVVSAFVDAREWPHRPQAFL